jgi:hypothetical protein
MAAATDIVASFLGGLATVGVQYDDVTGLATAVNVTVNGADSLFAQVSGAVNQSRTFTPGANQVLALPNIPLTKITSGILAGTFTKPFNLAFRYPA